MLARAPARERQARRAQRRPCVVRRPRPPRRDPTAPRAAPRPEVELGEQVGEEARALRQAARAGARARGRPAATALRRASARGAQPAAPISGRVLAEVERDAPGAPERARADPHELAARAQAVEPGLRVGAGAPRQHVALPDLGGQREALQRHEHLAQAVDPGAGAGVAVHALPRGQEGGEAPLVGRLDLLAQRRQRRAAQAPQHLDVAPLALRPRRDEARRGRARRRARARAAPRSRRRRSARAAPRS